MGFRVRVLLLGTVACVIVAFSASVAQAAGFSVESLYAANCKTTACEANSPISEYFTQASGHPIGGITDFKIKTHVIQTVPFEAVAPEGNVKEIRTNVAPGVATNPEAVKKCSIANFTGTEVEPVPGLHAFTAPNCPESEIGSNVVHVVIEVEPVHKIFENFVLQGKLYNLEQPEGLSSYFGVALSLEPVLGAPLYTHVFLEGHVEWGSEPPGAGPAGAQGTGKADYHDYYIIKNVTPGLIESRLTFNGTAGNTGLGGFVTNPSTCSGTGPQTTTGLRVDSYEGASAEASYSGPVGTEGCNGLTPFEPVPFAPGILVKPDNTQSDQPDGVTTELSLPHDPSPTGIDSSQLDTASVTLPEGMTLNPSGAQGLEACTPAQARIHSHEFGTACPAKSEIGTVTLNVPTLPEGSLAGKVYLGGPPTGPISGPPYTIYIDAGSTKYDVSVRLEGKVTTDETTGRVTATLSKNPEQPFSKAILTFKPGALSPIANPLVCGPAKTETTLSPYTGTPSQSPFSEFVVDGNGKGGACASPLPFSLGQSTASSPTTGGANTSFTFSLGRADGQQYLSKVSAALPLGLIGKIPAVPLCAEPQASLGTCLPTSQIGTATATVGSGASPVQFTGPVYLTGPTGSAPYGMTTVINATVGPFSLGNDVVRTGIEVDPYTARVTVAGDVPTIFKGIPLRLKGLTVAITTPGFLINPTNCGTLSTNTTLTSSFGATQTLSTPFQATNCSALAFKPKFSASSNGKTSRANGAALNAKIGYPTGVQSSIKSLLVKVPKQLPSRLSTLKNACREAVFAKSPYLCPTDSRVGGATVRTPALPEKLTGPAYFVSHGGAAFPDLDFVLTGNGITVILVGNTNIQKGITTTNFASLPDVPVSSFEENLPVGKNSAVTANGSLCKQTLVMPTTITAQNGKVIKQNTKISVSGCPVTVISKHVSGNNAVVTVRAPSAGRVSASGSHLKTVYRHPGKAQNVTLSVPLSSSTRPLAISVRIGFIPKKGSSSVARTGLVFP